jgi:CRISPR-associated protein Csy2
MSEAPAIDALLVLPRLRIQSANAISSPLTWGFPSITAFVGLMHALQRRLPNEVGLKLRGVGVVCHRFEAQATRGGFVHTFHLARHPVDKDGSTAAIVEEGRIHLEVTLVFGVTGPAATSATTAQRERAAEAVADLVAGMRVAGGSVLPPSEKSARHGTARMVPLGSDLEDRVRQFRSLRRTWLPGFALVCRDDLMRQHHAEIRQKRPDAALLDAWLDMCRLQHRAEQAASTDPISGAETTTVEWSVSRRPGWIVPIPVGYGSLSDLHAAGTVQGARDSDVPFRFVESLYSLGQWISPHRLQSTRDLLWHTHSDPSQGLYRCVNHFSGASAPFVPLED